MKLFLMISQDITYLIWLKFYFNSFVFSVFSFNSAFIWLPWLYFIKKNWIKMGTAYTKALQNQETSTKAGCVTLCQGDLFFIQVNSIIHDDPFSLFWLTHSFFSLVSMVSMYIVIHHYQRTRPRQLIKTNLFLNYEIKTKTSFKQWIPLKL